RLDHRPGLPRRQKTCHYDGDFQNTSREPAMSAISLDLANRIIEAVLRRAAQIDCRPISVIVVEPGCKVKAFQKEDGSSMVRFEMAFGKAYAALALGRSSKLVRIRARS